MVEKKSWKTGMPPGPPGLVYVVVNGELKEKTRDEMVKEVIAEEGKLIIAHKYLYRSRTSFGLNDSWVSTVYGRYHNLTVYKGDKGREVGFIRVYTTDNSIMYEFMNRFEQVIFVHKMTPIIKIRKAFDVVLTVSKEFKHSVDKYDESHEHIKGGYYKGVWV